MPILIYIGVALAVIGVLGFGYCIVLAFKIRREGAEAIDIKSRMQRLAAMNMAALSISVFGLIMVIMGMVL